MIRVAVLGHETLKGCQLSDDSFLIEVIEVDHMDVALEEIQRFQADIVVLDQDNELLQADLLCMFLARQHSRAQCLILTEQQPDFAMLQKTGFTARGYITPHQRQVLGRAIRAVHDGEAWLPRRLVAEMLNRFAAGSAASTAR